MEIIFCRQAKDSQLLPTALDIPFSPLPQNAGQPGDYDDDGVRDDIDFDPSHRFIGTQKLSEMLQQPYDLFKPGWADHYILGMVNQVDILIDKIFVNPESLVKFGKTNFNHFVKKRSLDSILKIFVGLKYHRRRVGQNWLKSI